jgi:hypothetical protein
MLEAHGRIVLSNGEERYNADVSNCLLMLHEALALLPKREYQSPHWEREPTQEMRDAEEQYLEECYKVDKEIERLASNIYLALTGNKRRR